MSCTHGIQNKHEEELQTDRNYSKTHTECNRLHANSEKPSCQWARRTFTQPIKSQTIFLHRKLYANRLDWKMKELGDASNYSHYHQLSASWIMTMFWPGMRTNKMLIFFCGFAEYPKCMKSGGNDCRNANWNALHRMLNIRANVCYFYDSSNITYILKNEKKTIAKCTHGCLLLQNVVNTNTLTSWLAISMIKCISATNMAATCIDQWSAIGDYLLRQY